MKRVIVGAVLFFISIAPAMAEAEMSVDQFCALLARMGKAAVTDSQNSGQLADTMAAFNQQTYPNETSREYVKKVLVDAYKIPIQPSKKQKARVANKYHDKVEHQCHQDLGE